MINKMHQAFRTIANYIHHHPHRILAIIVACYLALGLVYLSFAPVFEKPDENWHFDYITYILDHHHLPPMVEDVEMNPAEQIAGHPPLYYILSSSLLQLIDLYDVRPNVATNEFWAVPVPGTVNDNKNHFLHPPGELASPKNRSFFLLRLLSLIIGIGTILGAYGIASAIQTPVWLRLAAAAGVAFTPQYLYIATSVSNDALIASLSAIAMLSLLLAIRPGNQWQWWIVFGVLTGLAALTKTSGLALLWVGAAAGILTAWRERSWKTGLTRLASNYNSVMECPYVFSLALYCIIE